MAYMIYCFMCMSICEYTQNDYICTVLYMQRHCANAAFLSRITVMKGENLKIALGKKGMTQSELADIL